MTSIDRLRRTLDEHASDLADGDVVGRPAAVHARVGVVRRRRRAAAAGGAAGLLAVVGAVVLVSGTTDQAGPEPADTIVGSVPPATLTSLGYAYDLGEGVEGQDGTVRVRLSASDQPRLVSWATSGGDREVTLGGSSFEVPLTYHVADFADFYYVAPGGAETIVITAAEGDPGAAVYTLGTTRPAGLTQDGVTFRQSPAGYELLGAEVAEHGRGEVTVAATASSGGVALRYYCTGGPSNAYLHVQTGDDPGDVSSGSGCDGTAPVDAFGGSGNEFATRVGEDVTTRFYVTAGPDGPLVDDPDLRIGLGVYARTDDLRAGTVDAAFPRFVEERGHVWRRVVRKDGPGVGAIERFTPDSGPVLARTYGEVGAGTVRTTITALQGTSDHSAGSGFIQTYVVNVGGTVRLDIVGGDVGPDDLLVIGYYERAD